VSHSLRDLVRFGRFLRPDTWLIAGVLTALLAGTGAGLAAPYLTGLVVGEIKAGLFSHVPLLCALIALAAVCSGGLGFIRGYLAEFTAQRAMFRTRNAIYEHLQRQGFAYFDQAETGQIMSRATGDVETMRRMISRAAPGALAAIVQFVGTATIMLALDWRLALAALAIAPLFVWTVLGMSRRLEPAAWQLQQQLADVTSVVQENLSAQRVVRAFARTDHEEGRFDQENRRYLDRAMDVARIQARYQPLLSQLPTLGTVIILAYGGYQAVIGQLSLGMFTAFYSYVLTLLGPLRMISNMINMAAQASASAHRIFDILDASGEIRQKPHALVLPRLQGEVIFEHVTAQYGKAERNALCDINLAVQPGERVALVGATGAGKSTLVYLIPRFYDPTAGRILIDGHDIRDVDIQSLRRQIGFVLQDPFLFSASIEDNIRYGRPKADHAEVAAAARAAHIAEFIDTLPDRYQSVIGERGTGLSGGQRQRLAIARALLCDPAILILDDATSSVDSENEHQITAALEALMHGRTTFVIAHRLASVVRADKIIVLNAGQVEAVGPHAELLERSPLYRTIYELQLAPAERPREVAG